MSLSRDFITSLGLSGTDIQQIISTAPARYKVYPIPKRNGAGWRIIAQPSRELKALQNYILYNKISVFPVHENATAYAPNRSIRSNAEKHRKSNFILKLDFTNFFPSIKAIDWEKFAKKNPIEEIEQSEIKLYSKIMFWGQQPRSVVPRCLSIGAPTSPALSNILLYEMDIKLTNEAQQHGIYYTRYADDITISGESSEVVVQFEKIVKRTVRDQTSPKLQFNADKRGLYHRGQRRMVTGLVITPAETISLGRDRKRFISSLIHKSKLGQLSIRERSKLKGLLGFAVANEPDFLGRLRQKYGNEAVTTALTFHAPKRAEME